MRIHPLIYGKVIIRKKIKRLNIHYALFFLGFY
jgi:hypothetical protein